MTEKVLHYRELRVGQRSMDLVVDVYRVSQGWPSDERFGLTNQVRRAAVSVPANIAEGQGRAGTREFLQHLSIAYGSLCEVETHLFVARRLDYCDAGAITPILENAAEVGRLINGLTRSLREKMSALATDH